MFEKLRDSLNKNKIFLELLNVICLAGILGFMTYRQAVSTNEMNEAKLSPVFIFKVNQLINPKTNAYDTNELLIENHGEVISNFQVKKTTALYLHGQKSGDHIFPVVYYFVGLDMNSSKGLLYKGYQPNNNADYIKFERSLEQHNGNNDADYLSAQLKSFFTLSYIDIMGRHKEKCFMVTDFSYDELDLKSCTEIHSLVTKRKIYDIGKLELNDLLSESTQEK